ncbi:DNA N-6-adenine-methyltransferase [Leptolyngbya sp. AN02str]|uniref:DNA N-6-adenine-methyltransferase n=1 Tax=Leptolyngbya sp. AN02str TaxID=3423363 RepID=UPI003D31332A
MVAAQQQFAVGDRVRISPVETSSQKFWGDEGVIQSTPRINGSVSVEFPNGKLRSFQISELEPCELKAVEFQVGDRVRVLKRNKLNSSIWGQETEVLEVISPGTVDIALKDKRGWPISSHELELVERPAGKSFAEEIAEVISNPPSVLPQSPQPQSGTPDEPPDICKAFPVDCRVVAADRGWGESYGTVTKHLTSSLIEITWDNGNATCHHWKSIEEMQICKTKRKKATRPPTVDAADNNATAIIETPVESILRVVEQGEISLKIIGDQSSAAIAPATPAEIVPGDEERLDLLEEQISEGLEQIEAGKQRVWQAVAEIQQHQLWRVSGHESFESYCKQRWGWERSNAYEVAEAGKITNELQESGIPDSELPTSVSQTRELKKIAPEQRAEALRTAIATTNGKPTAKAIRAAVQATEQPIVCKPAITPEEFNREMQRSTFTGCHLCKHRMLTDSGDRYWCDLGEFDDTLLLKHNWMEMNEGCKSYATPATQPFREGDEWGTPDTPDHPIITKARLVFGGEITLDPASNDLAQQTVQAKHYYTIQTNGLKQPWFGNVWLNAPYSFPLIELFNERLIEHWQEQKITAALSITNNATETGWYQELAVACTLRLDFTGRIPFHNPYKTGESNRQGQSLFYFGHHPERFIKAFGEYGLIYQPPINKGASNV